MARAKTGVNGRAKGKRGEADIAERLADWLNLPMSEFQKARAGKKEADVGFSLRARALFNYHCEIKHHAVPAYEAWIAQAMRDAPLVSGDAEPVVMFKEDRKIFVFTRLSEFFRLCVRAEILDYSQVFPDFATAVCTKALGMWIRVPFNTFMELATVKMADGEEAA